MKDLPNLFKPFVVFAGVFVASGASGAEPIRPTITAEGSVILEIPATPEGDALQEYSVQVSGDLESWLELERASLMEELEVRDHAAAVERSRFYRVVPVELSEAARLFALEVVKELDSLDGFASGIVLDGVTLDEYQESQLTIAEARELLEEILAAGERLPGNLLRYYQERIRKVDSLLASNPLRLEFDGRSYEINVSEAMRVLSEEFQRLGLVSLPDYDRLPGIDSQDLKGLETLQEYLAARQLGETRALAVFDAFSPYGNFLVTHRLVLKHIDILAETAADADNDGAWEVDYELYRRLLNGLERALREAEAIVATVVEEVPIPWHTIDPGFNSESDLAAPLVAFDRRHEMLLSRLEDHVHAKGYEAVLEQSLLGEVRALARRQYNKDAETLKAAIYRWSVSLETLPEYAGVRPGEPASETELEAALGDLNSWYSDIRDKVNQFIAEHELSGQVADTLKRILEGKLNFYWSDIGHRVGIYQREFDAFSKAVSERPVIFQLEGIGAATLLDADLHFLSARFEELLALPGVASVFDEDGLRSLHASDAWRRLTPFTFEDEHIASADALSPFGVRLQLIPALAEAIGPASVQDGIISLSVVLAFALGETVVGEKLVEARAQTARSLAELESLALEDDASLSSEEYAALMTIVRESEQSIRGIFGIGEEPSALDDLDAAMVLRLAQEAYAPIGASAGRMLEGEQNRPGSRAVRVVVEGEAYLLDAVWLRQVVTRSVARVSVGDGDWYTRRQYLRLRGADEAMLLALPRPWNWETLRRLDRPSYGSSLEVSLDDPVAPLDEQYLFFPALIERLGGAMFDDAGAIDDRLIEEALLEDTQAKVAPGETMLGAHLQAVDTAVEAILPQMQALDYSRSADWATGQALQVQLRETLAAFSAPLISNLVDAELEKLFYQMGYRSSHGALRELYEERQLVDLVYLDAGDDALIEVDVLGLSSIPSWPGWYEHVSADLFPNLPLENLREHRALRTRIAYSPNGAVEDSDLFTPYYDPRKLGLFAAKLFYENRQDLPEPYRSDFFADGKLNVEVFRRYVKGVDVLHQEIAALAEERVDERLAAIRELRDQPMTVESLDRLYQEIVALRANLIAEVAQRTEGQETADVIEIEEAVTRIYSEAFGELVDYARGNPLTVVVEGARVIVPYSKLSEAIIHELQALYPGESLRAHHFAALPGIAVADLRKYEMLESFLGNQLVALPRHSQEVEVRSTLSELGMMQLISDALKRFGSEVVDASEGVVDVEAFMERLLDDELALERALQRVDALFDAGERKIAAIREAATRQGFEDLNRAFTDVKLEVVDAINSYVSQFDVVAFNAVQQRVDERLLALVAARDSRVIGVPTRIEAIDGTVVMLDIAALEEDLVSVFAELVDDYETSEDLSVDSFDGSQVSIAWAVEPRWYPRPLRYDPDDGLTRFGFHHLVTRLIAKYGSHVVVEEAFSVERFAAELEREDEARAAAIFDRIFEDEFARVNALLSSSDEAIEIEQVERIADVLDSSRVRFSEALNTLSEGSGFAGYEGNLRRLAQERWSKLVEHYEDALGDRPISISVNGRQVSLPATQLLALMRDAYQEGRGAMLDDYLEGGETAIEYQRFRSLYPDYSFHMNSADLDDIRTRSLAAGLAEGSEYPFSLGDLLRLPGVSPRDLEALEVESKTGLELAQLDPEKLLRGLFNMRALAPGSVLQSLTAASFDDAAVFSAHARTLGFNLALDPYGSFFREPWSFTDLSWRDQRFRVLVQLVLDHAELLLTEEGTLDVEAFAKLFGG